jgi:hypothetical protein
MTDANATQRVVATKAALEAIRALQAASGRLMFFMSGGCCDGSLPICLQAGELITGPADVLLGQVGGCDFWLGAGQDAASGRPQFELDVEAGIPEGFSLGTLGGGHFIVRSPSFVCPPSGGPSRMRA